MAHVAVLCSVGLADGFRLAGVAAYPAAPGPTLRAALPALLGDPELGLLFVTQDLWTALDEATRASLEYLPRPVVLDIPAGEVAGAGARRELIGEMLQRAIGYRIELGGAGQ